MDPDGTRPATDSKVTVGQDLSAVSVDELRERITLLESEIVRIRAEIAQKQASIAAANSIFGD